MSARVNKAQKERNELWEWNVLYWTHIQYSDHLCHSGRQHPVNLIRKIPTELIRQSYSSDGLAVTWKPACKPVDWHYCWKAVRVWSSQIQSSLDFRRIKIRSWELSAAPLFSLAKEKKSLQVYFFSFWKICRKFRHSEWFPSQVCLLCHFSHCRAGVLKLCQYKS